MVKTNDYKQIMLHYSGSIHRILGMEWIKSISLKIFATCASP
jgi:hypothetical protein